MTHLLEQVVICKLKEWKCVQVDHHKDVGEVIEEWQSKGWRLHTYQATGSPTWIIHYLLFEKD
jgi:hypothetical protein